MRFLHTADWQIGMKCAAAGDRAKDARDERLGTIKRIVDVANERDVDFMLVAGDLFDTLTPKAADMGVVVAELKRVKAPVFVLPGNHDPAGTRGPYASAAWRSTAASGVVTVERKGVCPVPGGELLVSPCESKYEVDDPTAWFGEHESPPGAIRVGVAHGSLVETERGLLIRLEAAQTLLTLMPERPVTIAWHSGDSNERKKLEAGQRFEIAADGRFLIELAGVARIEISRPVNDVGKLRAELSGCKKFLAELQRDLGTRDPAELQKRLVERLNAAIASLTEGLTKLRGDLVTAQKAQSATDEEWRRLEAMAGLLPDGVSPTDPETHLQAAYAKRFEAERKVAEARAAYAPYHSDEEPLEELKRLQDLANDAMRNEVELKARVVGLEQDLADGYAEAPASKLTELEEELERLRAKLADEEVTEAALHLLQTFVTEAEARRVENFAQPLLDCVAPWFAEVTGNELLRLNLSVDNQVNGLRLAGVDHEVRFDELSQGTCDQLALLIRLAFASLLTQPQRLGPMPVLLDDPLVHADWERRPRFGKILEDISSTAQVIVFTCRPEDYSGTSGQVVTLGEAVRLRAGAA
jgi:hypothetical protein